MTLPKLDMRFSGGEVGCALTDRAVANALAVALGATHSHENRYRDNSWYKEIGASTWLMSVSYLKDVVVEGEPVSATQVAVWVVPMAAFMTMKRGYVTPLTNPEIETPVILL